MIALVGAVFAGLIAPPLEPIWPAGLPEGRKPLGAETTRATGDPAHPVHLLSNVSDPSIAIYRAPRSTGAAVMVCPGGGYNILAIDLEGTEICTWLNSIGVTAILLQYRVPAPDRLGPIQDAQRAMGIIRHDAAKYRINPNKIGVLGFSAGGHLAARLCATPVRAYARVDAADDESCRPNFSVLIYPAYVFKDAATLNPEVAVGSDSPPTFLVMTSDDPLGINNVLAYTAAMSTAKRPVEAHVFAEGGHGYGLRKSDKPVSHWPDLVREWLKRNKWI